MLTGCYDYDHEEVVVSGDPVRVDLAFMLSSSSSNKTRMADAVVQTNSARTYDILDIIPIKEGAPDIHTISNEIVVDKPDPKAQFYHYGSCEMSPGVDKCIVYAKAQAATPLDGVTSKAHNGSLTVSYNGTPSETFPTISAETDMSKLSFSPVSMLTSTTAEAEAQALAKYLTDIANAETANIKWRESTDKVLKRLYTTFINSGADIPGSAVSVKKWANQLKTTLDAQAFASNTEAYNLKSAIMALCNATTVRIDETDYTVSDITYPRDKDLPDGAAVLRWDDTNKEFVPQTQTTTLDNISTITRYAYPPELYYFVESGIRCKDSQVEYQSLYGTYDTWADFIGAAFPDEEGTDNEIKESTHSVALTTPVQYAVAHLQVNVQAGADNLTDAAGTNIAVGSANFPLTGVIVGGQRAVDYKFDPIIPAANSEDDIKFLYDSQVNTYSNNAYAHYLNSSTAETANTLVLQSKDQEDVTIILEFENKSGSPFYGVNNGVVYPGTRFYLVGTIPKPTYDEAVGDYTNRVFTKAYTTVVNMTVNSLAGAYNVLPNILTSDLEVGVEVVTKWIAAKPTTVVLL